MSARTWDEVYDAALTAFEGQLPRAEDEARVVAIWERRPLLVEREVSNISAAYAAGRVRWCWSALASRLEKGERERSEVAEQGNERDAAIQAAEVWVRTAGFHFDRESELVHALFGVDPGEATADVDALARVLGELHKGHPLYAVARAAWEQAAEGPPELPDAGLAVLRPWRDDVELRRRMVELWRELRPRGERVELLELERAERYRASLAKRDELLRRRRALLEAEGAALELDADLDLTPIGRP